MADGATKKTKGDWISWKNRPYDSSRSNEANRRAELWQAFCDFVRENRGWITSPPGSRTAVIETERGSTLPQKLAKLGYAISELPGTYERLTGIQITPEAERLRRKGHAIDVPSPVMLVDRYEIVLPWAAPAPSPMKKRPT